MLQCVIIDQGRAGARARQVAVCCGVLVCCSVLQRVAASVVAVYVAVCDH